MAKAPKPAVMRVSARAKNLPKNGVRKRRLSNTTENMTDERWKKVIAHIANGGDRKNGAKAAGISLQTLEAYLISNVQSGKQIREAQMLAIRRDWPTDLLEQVLTVIASGKTLKAAAKDCGVPAEKLPSLNRLLLKDPAIRKVYDEARELQAESFLDEIIDIADETENDFDDDGKANHELVNRSRVRIDTRKFHMGSMVKRRFGDNKQVELNGNLNINHAAVLSGGRKRLEELAAARKPATIDNATGEVS